jgi:D-alanyl-D-alanine carboxypeptidase/D-alanyl-D-alanine-endopeptidase (penicillin-binding protein 4)
MPEGPAGNRLSLGGHYAAGCGPMSVTRAVMRAPDFAFGTFKTYWQQSGGMLDGGMRLGTVPPGARLVFTYESLTLGAEKAGRPGSAAGGERVMRDFLASRGIVVPDLVLENGSGLSRAERISAQGLAAVLLDAWRSPYAAEFQASLPLSAVDGTLRRRFRSPDMEGRPRMKTGTLQDVSALAGYVHAASGKTYVAVIILNHPGAEHGAGEQVQAALVDWVFAQ